MDGRTGIREPKDVGTGASERRGGARPRGMGPADTSVHCCSPRAYAHDHRNILVRLGPFSRRGNGRAEQVIERQDSRLAASSPCIVWRREQGSRHCVCLSAGTRGRSTSRQTSFGPNICMSRCMSRSVVANVTSGLFRRVNEGEGLTVEG